MGAGVRTKKVAFVGVKVWLYLLGKVRVLGACLILVLLLQVYAVALYVEAEPAANELGIRHRGGFFTDDR